MKKHFLKSCTMLILGLAATQGAASAQEPGLDGLWLANITSVDCQTKQPLPVTFRALYMFGQDGSLTTEAAFFMASPRRSSGLGAWQHTTAHAYTSTFWFFRYNPDGSFLSMREVSSAIQLNGNQYTTSDTVLEYDASNNLISTTCAVGAATRAQ